MYAAELQKVATGIVTGDKVAKPGGNSEGAVARALLCLIVLNVSCGSVVWKLWWSKAGFSPRMPRINE